MMNTIPTKEENPNGFHQRYILAKADSWKAVYPNAEYFVMRLDKEGNKEHVNACRKAIMVYADEIEPHIPKLAEDLRERYSEKV